MITLTGWDDILSGIFSIYWLVAFSALGYVVYSTRKKTGWARWWRIGAVLLVFFSLPLSSYTQRTIERYQRKAQIDKAMARYEALCKGSGEFIHRTADGVEGVLLMKLRPSKSNWWGIDAVDPFGFDFDGSGEPFGNKGYIETFLSATKEDGSLSWTVDAHQRGYRYVDLISPDDGKRYRYTAYMGVPPNRIGKSSHEEMLLKAQPVVDGMVMPRYGVTYDDITRPEDRQLWIAGSSLRVVDLETGEVMGERIGYMVDRWQGSRANLRWPWESARAHGPSCPRTNATQQTRKFIEKVARIFGVVK